MKTTEGLIAWVDLSKGFVEYEKTVKYKDYIGGRGVGSYILFRDVPEKIHPLNPDNLITFDTGLLTGTPAPASARLSVCTKNVASGGFSFANSGSFFGLELKLAGIDHIIVKGKASSPVYLWISEGKVSIKKADHLWGKDTWETECTIRDELKDPEIRVGSIGPAGENLVTMACIIFDRNRAAGWGGCGAVLGSKNLKALAVRGHGSLQLESPQEFMGLMEKLNKRFDNSSIIDLFRRYANYGTSGGGGIYGTTPQAVKNMTDEFWSEEKTAKVHPQIFKEKYEKRRMACFGCPLYCSGFYEVREGKYKDLKLEALKTNVYRAMGSNLDISDSETILKANDLLDRYGMNCDTVSAVIAWAMEIFEKGIIDKKTTGGLDLKWGDGELLINLLDIIANRRGFGDILAKGVYRASISLGEESQKYAMHVKKHGMCEQAVRMNKGWALGIMTATVAGGHLCGAPNTEQKELSPEKGKRFFNVPEAGDGSSYKGKGKLVSWFEKYKMIADMTGLCSFTTYWIDTDLIGPDDFAEMINHATGWDLTGERLLEIGEKAYNIEKAFNTLHGNFKREDDRPPVKLFDVPVASGPFAGAVLDPEKWETMLDEYYSSHGWDIETGFQTKKGLEKLDLHEVAEKLKRAGKLL